ncbi:Trypsin-like peptidase domain containing protein [Candidatus Nanopelagicaceae bacterium]
MSQTPANKFIAAIVIVTAPFAMGAFFLAWSPAAQYENSDPKRDGYVQPRDISGLVERTQKSTVTVYCDNKESTSQGTAWAIDLKNGQDKRYPTSLITNHHVIEDCIDGGSVTVAELYEKEVRATIIKWDKKNDLAVLATDLKLKPLELSDNTPWPGYWVMAYGSASGFEGSVAFGSVLNLLVDEVLMTANVSGGNSGGPLVDNEGRVIGTVSWNSKRDQFNGAKSLDAMCNKILECDGESYWDYEE